MEEISRFYAKLTFLSSFDSLRFRLNIIFVEEKVPQGKGEGFSFSLVYHVYEHNFLKKELYAGILADFLRMNNYPRSDSSYMRALGFAKLPLLSLSHILKIIMSPVTE